MNGSIAWAPGRRNGECCHHTQRAQSQPAAFRVSVPPCLCVSVLTVAREKPAGPARRKHHTQRAQGTQSQPAALRVSVPPCLCVDGGAGEAAGCLSVCSVYSVVEETDERRFFRRLRGFVCGLPAVIVRIASATGSPGVSEAWGIWVLQDSKTPRSESNDGDERAARRSAPTDADGPARRGAGRPVRRKYHTQRAQGAQSQPAALRVSVPLCLCVDNGAGEARRACPPEVSHAESAGNAEPACRTPCLRVSVLTVALEKPRDVFPCILCIPWLKRPASDASFVGFVASCADFPAVIVRIASATGSSRVSEVWRFRRPVLVHPAANSAGINGAKLAKPALMNFTEHEAP